MPEDGSAVQEPVKTGVAWWRIAAAVAVLVAMAGFGVMVVPVYARNRQLQRLVDELTQRVESRRQGEDALRQEVLRRAGELGIPLAATNVQVNQSPAGVGIHVRYSVPVSLPGYKVDLHFHPGADSR